MTLPTREQIEHALALVTLAMPLILGGARFLLAFAEQLYAYAQTTAGKGDDEFVLRLLTAARWLDQIARAIGHAASLGVLRREPLTPALERFERQTRDPGATP